MTLPACTVVAEEARLDVGRGVAVLAIDAIVGADVAGACFLDATSVLRAREEGRAAPDLVAFRISVDGKRTVVSGPRGLASVRVQRSALEERASVRIVALLRGDRFALVPLGVDPAHRRAGAVVRGRAVSVYGTHAIAATARWIERDVPVLVTVDPGRDHEPMRFLATMPDGLVPIAALVVDAGPILGDEATGTEETRRRELALGGAAALSVLLSDLPLSIATAPTDASSVERLRETARAAHAAVLSADPLIAAVGERLTTAILDGFASCKRMPDATLPPRWPSPNRDLIATGILEDAESGCPRIDDLLTTNHPDVRFPREGALALRDASAELPVIGPMVSASGSTHARRPRSRGPVLVLLLFALAVLAFQLRGRIDRESDGG